MKDKKAILRIAASYSLEVLLEHATTDDIRLRISNLQSVIAKEHDLDIKNISEQIQEIKRNLCKGRKK